MRELILFVRYIPAFYKLFKKWYLHPSNIDFALTQYVETISELTGGKLSKVCYASPYIVDTVRNCFCEDCDLKEETK